MTTYMTGLSDEWGYPRIKEGPRFIVIAALLIDSFRVQLFEDYFLAVSKRLLISSQLTTFHHAAR